MLWFLFGWKLLFLGRFLCYAAEVNLDEYDAVDTSNALTYDILAERASVELLRVVLKKERLSANEMAETLKEEMNAISPEVLKGTEVTVPFVKIDTRAKINVVTNFKAMSEGVDNEIYFEPMITLYQAAYMRLIAEALKSDYTSLVGIRNRNPNLELSDDVLEPALTLVTMADTLGDSRLPFLAAYPASYTEKLELAEDFAHFDINRPQGEDVEAEVPPVDRPQAVGTFRLTLKLLYSCPRRKDPNAPRVTVGALPTSNLPAEKFPFKSLKAAEYYTQKYLVAQCLPPDIEDESLETIFGNVRSYLETLMGEYPLDFSSRLRDPKPSDSELINWNSSPWAYGVLLSMTREGAIIKADDMQRSSRLINTGICLISQLKPRAEQFKKVCAALTQSKLMPYGYQLAQKVNAKNGYCRAALGDHTEGGAEQEIQAGMSEEETLEPKAIAEYKKKLRTAALIYDEWKPQGKEAFPPDTEAKDTLGGLDDSTKEEWCERVKKYVESFKQSVSTFISQRTEESLIDAITAGALVFVSHDRADTEWRDIACGSPREEVKQTLESLGEAVLEKYRKKVREGSLIHFLGRYIADERILSWATPEKACEELKTFLQRDRDSSDKYSTDPSHENLMRAVAASLRGRVALSEYVEGSKTHSHIPTCDVGPIMEEVIQAHKRLALAATSKSEETSSPEEKRFKQLIVSYGRGKTGGTFHFDLMAVVEKIRQKNTIDCEKLKGAALKLSEMEVLKPNDLLVVDAGVRQMAELHSNCHQTPRNEQEWVEIQEKVTLSLNKAMDVVRKAVLLQPEAYQEVLGQLILYSKADNALEMERDWLTFLLDASREPSYVSLGTLLSLLESRNVEDGLSEISQILAKIGDVLSRRGEFEGSVGPEIADLASKRAQLGGRVQLAVKKMIDQLSRLVQRDKEKWTLMIKPEIDQFGPELDAHRDNFYDLTMRPWIEGLKLIMSGAQGLDTPLDVAQEPKKLIKTTQTSMQNPTDHSVEIGRHNPERSQSNSPKSARESSRKRTMDSNPSMEVFPNHQRSEFSRNDGVRGWDFSHELWFPQRRLAKVLELREIVLSSRPSVNDIAKRLTPPHTGSKSASYPMLKEFRSKYGEDYDAFVKALPQIIDAALLLGTHSNDAVSPLGSFDMLENKFFDTTQVQKVGGFRFSQKKLRLKAKEWTPQNPVIEVPAIKPGLTNSDPNSLVATQKLSISPFAAYSLVAAILLGVETRTDVPSGVNLNNFWISKPQESDAQQMSIFGLQMAKLRSLAHYLTHYGGQALLNPSTPSLTVEYKRLKRLYSWSDYENQKQSLKEPILKSAKTAGKTNKNLHEPNSYVVDFADKQLSGGFLSQGGVQEELLFLSCPVLTSIVPLVPELEPNAAMVIENFMETATYTGYGRENKVAIDELLKDRKADKSMIAIDATEYNRKGPLEQYKTNEILREANKVLASLSGNIDRKKRFATGLWGCGFFKGDPALKFMVQWAVTSMMGMEMVYYPCRRDHTDQVADMVKSTSHLTVGKLWELIGAVARATTQERGFYAAFSARKKRGTA